MEFGKFSDGTILYHRFCKFISYSFYKDIILYNDFTLQIKILIDY